MSSRSFMDNNESNTNRNESHHHQSSPSQHYHNHRGMNTTTEDLILSLDEEIRNILYVPNMYGTGFIKRKWTDLHLILFQGSYQTKSSSFFQTFINFITALTSDHIHCELSFTSKYPVDYRVAVRIVQDPGYVCFSPEKNISKTGYQYCRITANPDEIGEILKFSLIQKKKPFNPWLVYKWWSGDLARTDFEKSIIQGTDPIQLDRYTCTTLAACSLAVIPRWRNFVVPGSGGIGGYYAWSVSPSLLLQALQQSGSVTNDGEFHIEL